MLLAGCLRRVHNKTSPVAAAVAAVNMQNGASQQKGKVLVQEHVPKVKVSRDSGDECCVASSGQQFAEG